VKILLVRLRLLGDVVFTTPAVRALRRRFPDAQLTYVVEPAASGVVLGSPHLDDVMVLPMARGWARLKADAAAAWTLRHRGFDIAIDMHGGPRAAWLTWASGAPRRIGYAIKGRRWMYTTPVERSADLAPRHSVESQWDLLTPLGVGPCDTAHDPVEMPADSAATRRVAERLHTLGVDERSVLIVMHVSAGNAFRRWPADSFSQVAARLARADVRRRVVVTAGPSEPGVARAISAAASRHTDVATGAVLDGGDFDAAELRALILRASVYIGGDSGPMHVAATTETPIVALLGPTLAERSKPWRDPRWFSEMLDVSLPCRPCHQKTCEPGDFRCLRWIGPDRVVAAAERALASRMGSGTKVPA
jgi:lipopolysaccharide heptosyltransferase II